MKCKAYRDKLYDKYCANCWNASAIGVCDQCGLSYDDSSLETKPQSYEPRKLRKEAIKIQWKVQRITADIGKYGVSIERQSYDGRYHVRADVWDDKRGYVYFDDFTENTLIEAKGHIEELMRIRML